MKKIVICSNSLWNIYNFRYKLVEQLSKDFKIYIISNHDPEIIKKFNNLNIFFYNIKISNRGLGLYDNFNTFVNLLILLFRIRPSYYLAFTIKPNIYGSLICRIFGIETINNITGLGNTFLKNHLVNKLSIILYKIALKKSKYVLFHNPSDSQLFIKNRITKNNNSYVIPGSGIDLNKFNYSEHRISEKKTINFIYFGRIITDKGIKFLIETVELINKDKNNFIFNFCGEYDKNDKNYLYFKYKISKIKNIKYHNHTDNIEYLLSEMDCVLLPSKREGMPRSLLEASALGIPIIASDVPGCNHLIKDNVNGFLFNLNHSKDLITKIHNFRNLNIEQKKKIIKRARFEVEKNYDENHVIQFYFDILEKKY